MMDLGFTVRILMEGDTFIAHVPELDVSSCGDTEADARRNITDAVQGFLETAREQGALNDILEEAGYRFEDGRSQFAYRSVPVSSSATFFTRPGRAGSAPSSCSPSRKIGRSHARGASCTWRAWVDISVDRSSGARCLLKRLNLNDIRARIDRVFRAAGGRRWTAERARATPHFGAFGDPGGDPAAGVAPARRESKCARMRAQNQNRNRRNVLRIPTGIRPTKNAAIAANSMA
jgi:predicted RNase H-like HicB family nuclease